MSNISLMQRSGLFVLLFLLGLALNATAQTAGIRGYCKGRDGEKLVDHRVVIKRQGVSREYKTKCNKKGQYVYIGLPVANYTVEIYSPDGKRLFSQGTRLTLNEQTQVDFDLAKEQVLQEQDPAYIEQMKKIEEARTKQNSEFLSLKEHFDLGNYYVRGKKYDQAVVEFEKALQLAKVDNVPVLVSRIADAYSAAGKYDQAEEQYQKALLLQPESARIHGNYGIALAKAGKIDEAKVAFNKASELDPEGAANFYFNLGAILYNQGTAMDEAAASFKKTLEINPDHADAYYLTAQTLMGNVTMDETGKTMAPPELVDSLKSYLALEPEGKYAPSAKMLLQTMTGKVQTSFKAPSRRKRRKKQN